MNKVYKLKFDKRNNSLIAVSEIATNGLANSDNSNKSSLEQQESTNLTASSSDSTTSDSASKSIFSRTSLEYRLKLTSLTKAVIATTLGVFGMDLAQAAPSGAEIISGKVDIATSGSITTITNSPNSIINWKNFNIDSNEVVRFIQENSSSAVLNRVVGGEISKILGSLQSNGKVFLINPNGVLFGKGATVDVAGMIASTLDINNQDFLSGQHKFSANQEKDQAIARVINQGLIKVQPNGTLALIGGQVVNNGILQAKNGSVYLLAGNSIEIADLNNPHVVFKVKATNKAVNLGSIMAKNVTMLGNKVLNGQSSLDSFADIVNEQQPTAQAVKIQANGEVLLFGGSEATDFQHTQQTNAQVLGNRNSVVENNGTIDVSNAEGKAGKVTILGDYLMLSNNSQILAAGAQGGKVRLGGDAYGAGNYKLSKVSVAESGQLVNVSGQGNGANAGNSIFWGDYAYVDGTFLAQSQNAKAGLVETSGQVLDVQKNIKVSVSTGSNDNADLGTWLLDPNDIFIVSSNPNSGQTTPITSEYGTDNNTGFNKYHATPNGANTYILNSTVESWLRQERRVVVIESGNGNVTVQSTTIDATGHNSILELSAKGGGNTVTIDSSTINVAELRVGDPGAGASGDGSTPANPGKVVVTNSCLTAFGSTASNLGNINLTTQVGNITVTSSNFSSQGKTQFETRNTGHVTSTNSNYTGAVKIDHVINVTFTHPGKQQISDLLINANEDVKFTAGALDLNNVKVCTTKSIILDTTGADGVKITGDSNLSAGVRLNLTATTGKVVLNDTLVLRAINGRNGDLFISGQKGVETHLTGSTAKIQSANTGKILSNEGDVSLSGGTVTSGLSTLEIDAKNNVSLTDTNLMGATVCITAQDGNYTQSASTVTARMQSATVKALNGKIDITGGSVTATDQVVLLAKTKASATDTCVSGKSVLLNATAGAIELTGSNLTGSETDVKLLAANNIKFSNANVSAKTLLNATTSSGSIKLESGSKLKAESTVNLTATQGNLEVIDSNITSDNESIEINIKDDGTLSLTNSNISSNKAIDLNLLGTQTFELSCTTLTSKSEAVNISSPNDLVLNNLAINAETSAEVKSTNGDLTINGGSKISANKDVTIKTIAPGKTVTIADSNLTSNQATVNVTSQGKITTTNSNASAKNDVNIISTDAEVSVTGGKFVAETGIINITGKTNVEVHNLEAEAKAGALRVLSQEGDVTVDQGSKLTASKDATVKAEGTGKTVTIADSNLTSKAATVNITAKGKVTTTNSNASANKDVNVISIEDAVAVTGGKFIAETGLVNITGKTNVDVSTLEAEATQGAIRVVSETGDVSVKTGSKLTSNLDTTIKAKESGKTVTLADSNLTSKNATVNITAPGKITTTNSNASAKNDVNVISSGAEVSVTGGKFVAETGLVNITGKTNVEVSDLEAEAKEGALRVVSNTGTITLGNGTKLSGKTGALVQTEGADQGVSITGTNISSESGPVNITSKGNLVTSNSNFSAKTGVNLDSETGTLEATDSLFKSSDPDSFTSLTAKGKVTVKGEERDLVLQNGTKIESKTADIEITSKHGASIEGTNLTATNGKVDITAEKNLSLSNTNISAKQDINLESKTGTNTITGSTFDSAEGKIEAKGNGDVTVSAGSKLTAQKDVNITSTAGAVAVTDSNVTSNTTEINLNGKTGVTTTNSNFSAPNDLKFTSETGAVAVNGGTLRSTTGNVSLNGDQGVTFGNGTYVNANKDIVVNSDKGAVEVNGTNLTSIDGTINITGQKDVVLNNSNLSSKNLLTIESKDGAVGVNNSNLTSKEDKVKINASKDLTLGNGTVVNAKSDITIDSKNGSTSITGSNLNSTEGKVDITAKKDVSLVNSNISSKESINVEAKEGAATVNNTNLTSSNSTVSITADKDVTLGNGTIVGAKSNITIDSKNGSTSITGTNLNSTEGKVDITAKKDVSLVNSNISSKESINVQAKEGSTTVNNTNLTSSNSTVSILAQKDVTLGNGTIVNAKENVTIKAIDGGVSVTGTNLTSNEGSIDVTAKKDIVFTNSNTSAAKELNLNSTDGSLTSNNSKFEAKAGNVTMNGDKGVNLGNGTVVNAKENVSITSPNGSINVVGTNISAENGDVNVTAKENITYQNANVSAGKNINSNAENGTLTANNSKFDAKGGNVNLNGDKGVNLGNGTVVNAKENVSITAPNGSINVAGTNITSENGDITVTAKENITYQNANVSAGKDLTVEAGNEVQADNTKFKAKEDISIQAKEKISITNSSQDAKNIILTSCNVDTTGTGTTGNLVINANCGSDKELPELESCLIMTGPTEESPGSDRNIIFSIEANGVGRDQRKQTKLNLDYHGEQNFAGLTDPKCTVMVTALNNKIAKSNSKASEAPKEKGKEELESEVVQVSQQKSR